MATGMKRVVLAGIFLAGLFSGVEGGVSELDSYIDKRPIKIGAFNIQIFGETTYLKEDVRRELIKILSRYDIVLVQEIRDSSQIYISLLVDEINQFTRQDEPFSLVVSERLGRSNSKEQYAFLYRKKYVELLDTYTYEDPNDVFERPPYCVKFCSDVLDFDEFGIIGLHAKPEDVFNELNALDKVYQTVSDRFGVSNILIAGDLNADCSYISPSQLAALSIRRDPSYQWLINDHQDTTVSSSGCAYDRLIVKGDAWQKAIIPDSVKVFYHDDEYQLSEELALDVSDHYVVEMQIRGKCNRNLERHSPRLSVTVADDRTIPSADLSYIRYIYQKTDEKIPSWNAQVYKIDTRMNYVIATKSNVDVTNAVEEFFSFYEAFDRKLLSLESIAAVRKIQEGFRSFHDPYVYCMDTHRVSLVDLSVTCSLVEPLTCKMDVSRSLS
ncbi:deoxyribonuclease-1-like [Crassostrea virginica]